MSQQGLNVEKASLSSTTSVAGKSSSGISGISSHKHNKSSSSTGTSPSIHSSPEQMLDCSMHSLSLEEQTASPHYEHNQSGSGSDSNTFRTIQHKRYVRRRRCYKKHRLMPYSRRRFQSSLFSPVDALFLMFLIQLSTLTLSVSASFVGSLDYESKTIDLF